MRRWAVVASALCAGERTALQACSGGGCALVLRCAQRGFIMRVILQSATDSDSVLRDGRLLHMFQYALGSTSKPRQSGAPFAARAAREPARGPPPPGITPAAREPACGPGRVAPHLPLGHGINCIGS